MSRGVEPHPAVSEDEIVRYELRGRVAVITLNHPPVNALSTPLWRGIEGAFDRLAGDEHAHAAVLTAEGTKAFCAGADVNELDLPGRAERNKYQEEVMLKIAGATVPIVCAINGPAVGAGIVIASLCDYRVASEQAHFSWTEIDRGLVGGGGAHMRRIGVPEGTIREWLFSGRRYTAVEAEHRFLVDRVEAFEQVLPTAFEVAAAFAEKPRLALQAAKQAILTAEVVADWRDAYVAAREWAGPQKSRDSD